LNFKNIVKYYQKNIYQNQMKKLLLLLTAVLVACTSDKLEPKEEIPVFPDKLQWQLIQISNKPLVRGSAKIYFHFNPQEGEISGWTGCNEFTAMYATDKLEIVFGNFTVTSNNCFTIQDSMQEKLFLANLQATNKWLFLPKDRIMMFYQFDDGEPLILKAVKSKRAVPLSQ
jgi:heat shock protein HslJ